MSTAVYQFKITLSNIRPPIWRRFHVESDITFRQLHNIVQVVMGWENYHLYRFSFDSTHFSESLRGPGDKLATQRLDEFVQREGAVLGYQYDFGDSWKHKIVLEKILTGPDKPVPRCTHGRRACPPEDCGGVWGYMGLVEAMQERRGEQYREYKEWLGEDFDAEEFDMEKVNKRLADLQLRRG